MFQCFADAALSAVTAWARKRLPRRRCLLMGAVTHPESARGRCAARSWVVSSSRIRSVGNAATMRLNKYLSETGVCSRREADDWIAAGRVTINGVPASLGTQVRP